MDDRLKAFERLLIIMDELREQCPWDRKQTNETLRHLTIEETYELSDALLEGDDEEIKKELGDLFLHLVFYSKIGDEKGAFNVTDVLNSVCEKLISRHPHIYGDVEVKDEEEVKQNWEQLKLKEGNKSVLAGVPNSMPSMIKASRMQDKAAQVGFDWPQKEQVWEKVEEELNEFKDAQGSEKKEEFGDLIFSLINYARWLKINPDDAYVLNYLAYSWLERDYKIDQAMEMLEKAYALRSNDPYITDSIGWAYYLIENYIEAEKYIKKAVELMPEDPTVNDHYGDILWKLNRNIQARYFWNYVLSLDDADEDIKKKINIKIIEGLHNS